MRSCSFIAPWRGFDCVVVAARGEDVLDKKLGLRFYRNVMGLAQYLIYVSLYFTVREPSRVGGGETRSKRKVRRGLKSLGSLN